MMTTTRPTKGTPLLMFKDTLILLLMSRGKKLEQIMGFTVFITVHKTKNSITLTNA
jgi:hypothetical protein